MKDKIIKKIILQNLFTQYYKGIDDLIIFDDYRSSNDLVEIDYYEHINKLIMIDYDYQSANELEFIYNNDKSKKNELLLHNHSEDTCSPYEYENHIFVKHQIQRGQAYILREKQIKYQFNINYDLKYFSQKRNLSLLNLNYILSNNIKDLYKFKTMTLIVKFNYYYWIGINGGYFVLFNRKNIYKRIKEIVKVLYTTCHNTHLIKNIFFTNFIDFFKNKKCLKKKKIIYKYISHRSKFHPRTRNRNKKKTLPIKIDETKKLIRIFRKKVKRFSRNRKKFKRIKKILYLFINKIKKKYLLHKILKYKFLKRKYKIRFKVKSHCNKKKSKHFLKTYFFKHLKLSYEKKK